MRAGARPFWIVAALALAFLAIQASAAFNLGDLAPRTVSVTIAADSAAYLALAANPSSRHTCFVSEDSNGKVSVSMGAISGCTGGGAGTGINAGDSSPTPKSSRYAFHSLLNVANKGTKTVKVWANTTTTSGSSSLLEAAMKADGVSMGDSDYATTTSSPLTLAPGEVLQLGLRATTGSLTAGNPVTGTIQVVARK